MSSPVPHSRAIASKGSLLTDESYTLWQRVGGYWVIERSYGGAYLRSLWPEIRKSWSSSRPTAAFPVGIDPNR